MKRRVSLDEIALYLAKGCEVHPVLQNYFFDRLDELAIGGKISLTPAFKLKLFHIKLSQKIQTKQAKTG
jgi:hypothetical protein